MVAPRDSCTKATKPDSLQDPANDSQTPKVVGGGASRASRMNHAKTNSCVTTSVADRRATRIVRELLTDRRTLQALTSASNRSKGDRHPSNWIPADPRVVCRYIGDWVTVKARWSLFMDESDAGRIRPPHGQRDRRGPSRGRRRQTRPTRLGGVAEVDGPTSARCRSARPEH